MGRQEKARKKSVDGNLSQRLGMKAVYPVGLSQSRIPARLAR